MTARTAARPASPPPTIICAACRQSFPASGLLPEHCPRCGWRLTAETAERMHVFSCCDPDCDGRTSFTSGWMATLAREGWVWTCWACGRQQVARVPLAESVYLGFIPKEEPPEYNSCPT